MTDPVAKAIAVNDKEENKRLREQVEDLKQRLTKQAAASQAEHFQMKAAYESQISHYEQSLSDLIYIGEMNDEKHERELVKIRVQVKTQADAAEEAASKARYAFMEIKLKLENNAIMIQMLLGEVQELKKNQPKPATSATATVAAKPR